MAKVDDNDGEMQKQLKDIQKECRDLSVKINTKEKMQQELQKKITSLERTEEELVSKNLKLYIDYVGAREELQKLSLMKLEPQRSPDIKLQERGVEEPYGHCTSVTSEDEGLGEDSRREDSTGPNSLILDAEDEYRGHFDGVIVGLRQRESSLASQLCQAEARISELQDRLNVKEEQVLKLLSETCNYAMFQEQLSLVDRRRAELQEQVLELEEAENDSRSEAQRLQMVVLKMEERERLLEDEIHRTRLELESCECRLRGMEITDRELQAQVSYTEALVCKYEKHIGELESAESSLHQRIVELDHQLRMAKRSKVETKSSFSQTLNPHSEIIRNGTQIEERCIQTDAPSLQDLVPVSTGCKDSLIFRLKQLEEKDGVLREQLHQMDGINLMLWQKLHSLDNNIELCKKQERRNFADEARHQVASARLDDLLANPPPPPPKQPELPEACVQNMLVSLKENDITNRLVQLEQEHNETKKDLEAERTKRLEDVQKMDKEKLALEKDLKRVENERDQLQKTILHAQGSQEGCHNYDHVVFTVCQLREEEATLRSDLSLHELRVQEMCHEFEKKLKEIADTHGEREESWKNEIAILREKECEYQEELRSLRETRMSLKTEISSMIREKNVVLFELQQKLISLEGKKKASKPVEERNEKTCSDKCLQTGDFQSQSDADLETSVQSEAKICDEIQTEPGCLPSTVETTCLIPNLPENGMCDKMEAELSCVQTESKPSIQVQNSPDDTNALLATIQQLRDKGEAMERRMEELNQKESAYIETLENADKIISNLERGYQEKIVQLESSEKNLRQRIVELEESENQLREMMSQPERRSSADGWRISDLIKELVEAESRENALKEHADEVEASHRTLLQKLRDLERSNQQLREESQEQEEVLMTMREKQGVLRVELAQVHQSESALRLTLHQADEILAQRERSVLDQVELLEGEKRRLEETVERLRDEMAVLKLANVRLQEDDNGTSAEQVGSSVEMALKLRPRGQFIISN